jgi:histidine triad (HIT) family protein
LALDGELFYNQNCNTKDKKPMTKDENCLFCKIAAGEIPAGRVYEDEICVAFNDINPQAAKHILVIPREHFASLAEAEQRHESVIGYLMRKCAAIANQQGFGADGFRTVINTGKNAQQSVFHLHVHLLGGQKMNWNPA